MCNHAPNSPTGTESDDLKTLRSEQEKYICTSATPWFCGPTDEFSDARKANTGLPLSLVQTFLRSGPQISSEDKARCSRFKVFVYPLGERFHIYPFQEYDVGCLLHPCNTTELGSIRQWAYADYMSEIVLLSKFLKCIHTTSKPDEADLFLVPALPVVLSKARGCMGYKKQCIDPWLRDLLSELPFLSDPRKPHLFLCTQDTSQNPLILRTLLESHSNAIFLTTGPGAHIVVPYLNPLSELQPPFSPKPPPHRDWFVLANFGVRHRERVRIATQVNSYSGTRKVWNLMAHGTERLEEKKGKWEHGMLSHTNTVFTLCPPGDLPGGDARFFDAIVSGAIPVVISRTLPGLGKSWWDDNDWLHLGSDFPSLGTSDHTVSASYPDIQLLGLRYEDFVVEVSNRRLERSSIIDYLENLPDEIVMGKWSNLSKVRHLFQYNYGGTAPDAFSVVLAKMEQLLSNGLQQHAKQPFERIFPADSPNSLRHIYRVADTNGNVRLFQLKPGDLDAPVPAVIKFCTENQWKPLDVCFRSLLMVLRTDGVYSGSVEYSGFSEAAS